MFNNKTMKTIIFVFASLLICGCSAPEASVEQTDTLPVVAVDTTLTDTIQ